MDGHADSNFQRRHLQQWIYVLYSSFLKVLVMGGKTQSITKNLVYSAFPSHISGCHVVRPQNTSPLHPHSLLSLHLLSNGCSGTVEIK